MKLFTGTSWTGVATAAVACISVAGVWWTFWPGHREKLRERREQRLIRLLNLHLQIQKIKLWAGPEYGDASHDPSWYNASWGVIAFPWEYVEHFNRLVIIGDFPKDLAAALVQLERASREFHDMLADQQAYLSTARDDIGARWPRVVAAATDKGRQLTTKELEDTPGLRQGDLKWLAELYRRNKAIHVVGIGMAGSRSLHQSWYEASSSLDRTRAAQQAGHDPRWRWLGHATAGMFFSLGLLLCAEGHR